MAAPLECHRRQARREAEGGSVEIVLSLLLPATQHRSSPERLVAIAGRALADGTRSLRPKLKPFEKEDLESHLYEVGVECVTKYDPSRDNGSLTVPLDRRFSSFAYIRMRMRTVDWLRVNRGYTRPGRARVEEIPSGNMSADDPAGGDPLREPDFSDRLVSRTVVEKWRVVATASQMTMTEWAVDRLNMIADWEAAWAEAA